MQCSKEEKEQGLRQKDPRAFSTQNSSSSSAPSGLYFRSCSPRAKWSSKSKSGSGKHPKSSFLKMHRMNPSSTSASKDREVQTAERQQQTSHIKSMGYMTPDQGGVGRSGSSQSSSHHGRTHQGQESSANDGPPRPAPVGAIPDFLAACILEPASGGSAGQSGQHDRQSDEQRRAAANKVKYSIC